MKQILEKQAATLERIEQALSQDKLIQLSQVILQRKTENDLNKDEDLTHEKLDLSNNYLMRIRALTESVLHSVRGQYLISEKLLEYAEQSQKVKSVEQNIEAERDRAAMVDALKKIAENTSGKGKDEKKSSLGMWGTIIAAALGGIVGAITGYVKTLAKLNKALVVAVESTLIAIGKFFPSIKKMLFAIETNFVLGFEKIKDLSKMVFDNVAKKFSSIVGAVDDIIGKLLKSNTVKTIAKIFTNAVESIKTFFEPIQDAFKIVQEGSSTVGNIVKSIKGKFATILGFFDDIAKYVSTFGKVFGAVAKIIGKLAIPLTIITTVWDVISGAIDGFKKEGWVGAISGAIKGLIESITTGPMDLLKNVVSWILDSLGFEKASKFLDSFSFTDIMKGFVDAIFHPIDTIKSIFNSAVDFLDKIEIPEMSFTIPVIDKKVSIGPFKPFKKQSSGQTSAVSSASSSSSSSTSTVSTTKNQYDTVYREAIVAGKTPQEAQSIATSSANAPATKTASMYSPPPQEASAVYNRSAYNQQTIMQNQSSSQPVIVSAPTTVTNSNKQNIAMPQPIRNTDTGFASYLQKKMTFV